MYQFRKKADTLDKTEVNGTGNSFVTLKDHRHILWTMLLQGSWIHLRMKFLQFNIKDFYPYIKETSLHAAIQFAKEHVPITKKDIEVIIHVRKSVLCNDGDPWVK